MKKLIQFVLVVGISLGITTVAFPAGTSKAVDAVEQEVEANQSQQENSSSEASNSSSPASTRSSPADKVLDGVVKIGGNQNGNERSLASRITNLVNVFLFVVGALAVLMILFGGFKYVTSRGDANETGSAKNTILYAVIGLVIAISAYAIISFVVTTFGPGPAAGTCPGTTPNNSDGRTC